MPTATKTYITRTIARLYGIIEGITIDCRLNENEISGLCNWMERHIFLVDVEPFKGLWPLLNDILEDQIIDNDEKEELLEWCSEIINERGFLEGFTSVFRTLHGILGGIAVDKKITGDEIKGLEDWLLDYEAFKQWWPINEISTIVREVLKDGRIDEKEHRLLLEYFHDFAEQPLEHVTLHDKEYMFDRNLKSHSPFFEPIASICEKDPKITFQNNYFCFTGPAVSGCRKDLLNIVKKLGGMTTNTIIKKLDYLVIGAQSSPAWIYSTYGRKIEKFMQKNKIKNQVYLIQEKDFIEAATKAGGMDILPNPKTPPFNLTY